eukprot:1867391-Amphidinium_carterae.1
MPQLLYTCAGTRHDLRITIAVGARLVTCLLYTVIGTPVTRTPHLHMCPCENRSAQDMVPPAL